MVAAGIDVSKAMLDVALGESPVHRFANSGPGLRVAAAHGPYGGHTGGVRGHRRV